MGPGNFLTYLRQLKERQDDDAGDTPEKTKIENNKTKKQRELEEKLQEMKILREI